MFGIGLMEAAILASLLAFVFRRPIARRFPRIGRAVLAVLYITLAFVILYDLIALWRNAAS